MAPGDLVPVTRLRGPERRPILLGAVVVLGALVVAVVKPWGTAPVPPPASFAPASAAPSSTSLAAARPTGSRAPASARPTVLVLPADQVCYEGTAWRLYTSGRTTGFPVETWYSLRTAAATGPDDPGIPTLRVYAESIDRLGYCAITGPAGGPPIIGTRAWTEMPGEAAAPLALGRTIGGGGPIEVAAGSIFLPPGTGAGGLGAPAVPASPSASPAGGGPGGRERPSAGASATAGGTPTRAKTWPGGRYVFAIDRAAGAASDWFAIEIFLVQ